MSGSWLMPMLDTDYINERHLAPISSRLWVIVRMMD
jgi:hypothetical protein